LLSSLSLSLSQHCRHCKISRAGEMSPEASTQS
jgi:hypothetical protein